MAARVYKVTCIEGAMIPVVAALLGPEGTWLKNTGSGQQGISTIVRRIYERSSASSPATLLATTTWTAGVDLGTVVPYTGGATGPGLLGDGWTHDPEGYNFLDLIPSSEALFTLEGGHVYLLEYEINRTGTTNGIAWGRDILLAEITVLARYGS